MTLKKIARLRLRVDGLLIIGNLTLLWIVEQEAGNLVTSACILELGYALGALVHALGASVVEIAAGAGLVRGWHVAGQDDALALALDSGIGDRRG